MKLKEFFVQIGFAVDEAEAANIENRINSVRDTVQKIGVAAVAASAGLYALVHSTASESAEFAKLAEIMGVTTREAQKWSYATGQVGIDTKDLIELTAELAENMGEAADSATGEAGMAFKAFGLSVKDANGKLKQTPQFFEEIADAYAKETDARKKANFLTGAFGEQGIAFALLFKNGAEGIRAMREEAETLGLVMDDAAVQQGKEAALSFATFEKVLKAIKNTLAAEFLPTVNLLLREFIEWWKINREIVKQRFHLVFKLIMPPLKLVLGTLKILLSVLNFVIQEWRLFALILMTAVIAAMIAFKTQLIFLIAQVWVFVAASVKAGWASFVAWSKALLPLLPYIAALALLILILDDIWGWWNGKDSLIGRIIEGWKKLWSDFIDAMLKDNPNDPWWLKAIKAAVQTTKELIDLLRKINPATIQEETGSKVKRGLNFIQNATNRLQGIAPKVPVAVPQFTPKEQEDFKKFSAGLLNKAGLSMPTMPASNTKNSTVNNNQKIEIKIDGAKDPKQVALDVKDTLVDFLGNQALSLTEQF
jgi:hypothetical protein